jgi:hypothetical protein
MQRNKLATNVVDLRVARVASMLGRYAPGLGGELTNLIFGAKVSGLSRWEIFAAVAGHGVPPHVTSWAINELQGGTP